MIKRLIEADGVAVGYAFFGWIVFWLAVALAFTCTPKLLVAATGGLSAVLFVCAWLIMHWSVPGLIDDRPFARDVNIADQEPL
jgi:hypothetical protein